jgi:peroxiredoxin family protein
MLARGLASAAAAGTVKVVLHVTTSGRRHLSHSHSVRAVLVTTLKTASGAKLNLQTRTVTLDR